ncbi:hypothetical protein NQ318_014233 [Aromia moschata]|uniref:Circadian clock-controlled protein n=1 Tax=Aromia moschata TaxID=1265417 RepID=A0AAV8YYD8_9CUCU|nr:hypothetical protein NQ318_014233 [Aromia moschata]
MNIYLASFVHVCHKEDPNLIQCMMASVEDIRPFLVDGVPEYHIPSLEPLRYGVSSVNLDDYVFSLSVDLPKLRIEAHYNVDGKLLVVPVKGSGNLVGTIIDCKSKVRLQGELYEKNGETYLRYTSFDLHVDVGGGSVRLENLFNGDKILLEMINDVVNKNFHLFLKELMPIIENALSSVFLETANAIVESFTYGQLFP